jgi:hypothetical protein
MMKNAIDNVAKAFGSALEPMAIKAMKSITEWCQNNVDAIATWSQKMIVSIQFVAKAFYDFFSSSDGWTGKFKAIFDVLKSALIAFAKDVVVIGAGIGEVLGKAIKNGLTGSSDDKYDKLNAQVVLAKQRNISLFDPHNRKVYNKLLDDQWREQSKGNGEYVQLINDYEQIYADEKRKRLEKSNQSVTGAIFAGLSKNTAEFSQSVQNSLAKNTPNAFGNILQDYYKFQEEINRINGEANQASSNKSQNQSTINNLLGVELDKRKQIMQLTQSEAEKLANMSSSELLRSQTLIGQLNNMKSSDIRNLSQSQINTYAKDSIAKDVFMPKYKEFLESSVKTQRERANEAINGDKKQTIEHVINMSPALQRMFYITQKIGKSYEDMENAN